MVIVIIKMNVLPEKCLELKQTLQALIESTRKERGCLSHNVFQDIENDNGLSLIEEWESREDLDDHLRSDTFNLLMGARYLFSRPLEITINEVSHSSGWEALKAVRG
jgi:quinol monooxygenase YgiN